MRATRSIEIAPDVRLWAEESGDAQAPPLLLIMGANAAGLAWPDELVARLGRHHRVIRYDHRDTGRSSWAYGEHPYAIADLAGDAVALLDALSVDRAHLVGMSMGGLLAQLVLLDHPERVLSATLIGTSPLGGVGPGEPPLPDPDERLLPIWARLGEQRDREAELDFRVEHWRALHGDALPFDAAEFRRLEERLIDHAGRHDSSFAHALASQDRLDRGAELARVRTPTLVIESPEDPLAGPEHARSLARAIPGARLVTMPGMGHSLPAMVLEPLAAAILEHTTGRPPGAPASLGQT